MCNHREADRQPYPYTLEPTRHGRAERDDSDVESNDDRGADGADDAETTDDPDREPVVPDAC